MVMKAYHFDTVEGIVDKVVEVLPAERRREIAGMELEDFRVESHFGLGMWIRNNFLHTDGTDVEAVKADLERLTGGTMSQATDDDVSGFILDFVWKRVREGAAP